MENNKEKNIQKAIIIRNFILDKLSIFLSQERYKHTLGVEETAIKMARIFDVDETKASLSALLHDIAKEIEQEKIIDMAINEGWSISKWEKNQPRELLHAPASAYIASNEFGIKDPEILKAITYHTLGKEDMKPLEMIIFVADMIEPNRSFPGVEILRQIAFKDLEKAVLACLEHTLEYLHNKKVDIHPQTNKTHANLKEKCGYV